MKADRKIYRLIDILKLSEEYLRNKGIESARLEAEWMLQEALGISRINIYLNYDKPLNQEELSKLRDYISRRGKGEPIQYILGYTEFMGLKFFVNRNVLIPRPDTEVIVEKAIEIIKTNPGRTFKVLDIGTGSGNIAISIANHCPNVHVTAVDISPKAINVAKKNARFNKADENVEFHTGDFLKDDLKLGEYDILISNPPYIGKEYYKKLPAEVKEYEPVEALYPGDDELVFYRKIASVYPDYLKKGGYIIVEIGGDYQYDKVKTLFEKAGLRDINPIFDYSGEKRGTIAGVGR